MVSQASRRMGAAGASWFVTALRNASNSFLSSSRTMRSLEKKPVCNAFIRENRFASTRFGPGSFLPFRMLASRLAAVTVFLILKSPPFLSNQALFLNFLLAIRDHNGSGRKISLVYAALSADLAICKLPVVRGCSCTTRSEASLGQFSSYRRAINRPSTCYARSSQFINQWRMLVRVQHVEPSDLRAVGSLLLAFLFGFRPSRPGGTAGRFLTLFLGQLFSSGVTTHPGELLNGKGSFCHHASDNATTRSCVQVRIFLTCVQARIRIYA